MILFWILAHKNTPHFPNRDRFLRISYLNINLSWALKSENNFCSKKGLGIFTMLPVSGMWATLRIKQDTWSSKCLRSKKFNGGASPLSGWWGRHLRMSFIPVPQATRAAAKAGGTFMNTQIRKYGIIWPHLNGIDPLVSIQWKSTLSYLRKDQGNKKKNGEKNQSPKRGGL